MKLYTMKHATNPRRVRIFLAEKGIAIEQVEIDILKDEHLQPDYLRINPRGVLPALVLDDGAMIDESIAICRYIEEIHPDPNLMGRTPLEKAQIDSWQRRVEFEGLLTAAFVFRNEAPQFAARPTPGIGPQDAQIPALAARGRLLYSHFLDQLEQRLATSTYVAAERFTLADITALCAIDFAKWSQMRVPERHEATQAWYARLRERPSYRA